MKRIAQRMIPLTIFVVLGLILVACGATEEATPTVAPTAEPTATEMAEEPTPEESQQADSIAAIAAEDGRFSTLVTALEAAGLAETLAAEGEYTVFAPTDDAFAALPEGTVESLLEDPEGALTDVLLYHVAEGAVPADTVVTLESAATLQGESVSIEVRDGNVFLNGNVQVTTTDIQASNGIIHVIDGVLLPPSMAEGQSDDEMAEEEMASAMSIAQIAAEDGRFSTLVTALEAAGLAETLAAEGEYTVFAPTDDAFAALPEGTVESLLEDPQGALTDVLLYHVVEGAVPADTVVTLESATTLQGEAVSIEVRDGNVFLNGDVQVTTTDIQASNGIIHVIDGVLLPPSMAEGESDDEMAEEGETMTDTMSIAETLAAEGEYTVFAPTDDAFAALPEGTVEALLEEPQGALTNILLYHVVEGAVPADTVVTLESATTLQGEPVSIEVRDGDVFLNGDVQVIITDIQASNGIIHVIDAVLLPPS